jgi:hypothetical protein
MKARFEYIVPLVCLVGLALVILFVLPNAMFPIFASKPAESGELRKEGYDPIKAHHRPLAEELGVSSDRSERANEALLRALRNRVEADPTKARKNEVVVNFADAEALAAFKARAAAAGLSVLAEIPGSLALRIGYQDLRALRDDMVKNPADYTGAGPNWLVEYPSTVEVEERAGVDKAFGDTALAAIGADKDRTTWGRGVKIAVLDSGVTNQSIFNRSAIQRVDVGQGLIGSTTQDGHGTAVAALATGASGVAPAATLVSIRVTDESGVSDIYTLSAAIRAAADTGSSLINISLGSDNPSSELQKAIDYAYSKGAIVIASSGNDSAVQPTWPAAYGNVVAVGAVDADGKQATFSNSGENLDISAPGTGLNIPWADGKTYQSDGTSFSAPLTTGALAAVMSQNPGMTAQDAVNLLTQTASDRGAAGHDARFGAGTVNLGWALNANNPAYADPAIASHHFSPADGSMSYIIQNSGNMMLSNARLNVDYGNGVQYVDIPNLPSGETWSYSVAIDHSQFSTGDAARFRSLIVLPPNAVDANKQNNSLSTYLVKQK